MPVSVNNSSSYMFSRSSVLLTMDSLIASFSAPKTVVSCPYAVGTFLPSDNFDPLLPKSIEPPPTPPNVMPIKERA